MRGLKFRAWEKIRHEMWEVYGWREEIIEGGLVRWINGWVDGEGCHEFSSLMQFTGLLDKNGAEIYEGDIIRFNWGENLGYDPGATEMIDEVVFRDGCFYFVNPDVDGGAYAWRHNSHCEVIGNRWETPNLLEQSK